MKCLKHINCCVVQSFILFLNYYVLLVIVNIKLKEIKEKQRVSLTLILVEFGRDGMSILVDTALIEILCRRRLVSESTR